MTEPDNPPPQTVAVSCFFCDDPVHIPVEKRDDGPFAHPACDPYTDTADTADSAQ